MYRWKPQSSCPLERVSALRACALQLCVLNLASQHPPSLDSRFEDKCHQLRLLTYSWIQMVELCIQNSSQTLLMQRLLKILSHQQQTAAAAFGNTKKGHCKKEGSGRRRTDVSLAQKRLQAIAGRLCLLGLLTPTVCDCSCLYHACDTTMVMCTAELF